MQRTVLDQWWNPLSATAARYALDFCVQRQRLAPATDGQNNSLPSEWSRQRSRQSMRRNKQQHVHAATERRRRLIISIWAPLILLVSHGPPLVEGLSPSLRASHSLRSRSLRTSTCSLVHYDESPTDLSSSSHFDEDGTDGGGGGVLAQIAISADETWVMTSNSAGSWLNSWNNTGLHYDVVGYVSSPSYAKKGLLAHPNINTIAMAFSLVGGTTYLACYEYNAADGTVNSSFHQFGFSGEEDDILGAAMTSDGVLAILGGAGGVQRAVVSTDPTDIVSNWAFPGFEIDGDIDAESIVFSPEGSTLYIAGSSSVYATSSDGDQEAQWSVALSDSNLCDMAVSPDGFSVYVSGCSSGVIHHLQLDAANGVVISNATFSTDYSVVGGNDAGNAFLIAALHTAVVFCRSDSDEVVLYHRDASTGALFDGTTLSLGEENVAVGGILAGLSLSRITNKLFVSMAGTDSTGGIVVLDVECSTPTPTAAPALTPTEGCSLQLEQEVWADLRHDTGPHRHQIVVSQDETLIVTVDVSYTVIVAWSESDGMYAVADEDDKPSASGELRGLMLHPGLPTVYTFSNNTGSEDVFVYQFNSGNFPLSESGSVQLQDEAAGQEDLVVESVVSTTGVVAILGEHGGVRWFPLNGVGDFGTAKRYYGFGKSGSSDGTALAFSPDGSVIYIATAAETVFSFDSEGDNSDPPLWSAAVEDSELCDIVVSPSGLSVYVLGCADSVVVHLQLDETTGEVLSTAYYTADASIEGSTSGGVFLLQALEFAVMVGRPDSDEIVVFQRNALTGVLSAATTVKVTNEIENAAGTVTGLAVGSTDRLFVSMADDTYHSAIVVFNPVCYTAAPTPSPSPAPTSAPSPTVQSTRPELVEARLAAAIHGVDIVFNPGPWSLGLWCHENICSEGTCIVSDLLESGTVVLVGTGASCSWKDDSTVVVTFGTGYTLAENSTVVLNGDYIAGCATCTEYASGSTLVLGRALPPELSSAQFTDTGAQVTVGFTGNPSSQEINGTFDAVPCESVFSAASASTLGIGHTCQFSSGSSIKVTLGVLSTIAPSSSEGCTDGDGTSLTLLAGVVRTEIGAFLTSSAACVVLDYPANPDPPFVEISAPGAVGYCDDLMLEGSATMSSIDSSNVTWEVALAGSDPTVDLSNVSLVLEQASSNKELTVTIPSKDLAVENTFSFALRVDTVLGGSSAAVVKVYKSSLGLLDTQIVGSSALQRTRGNEIVLRSETRLSSCSTLTTDEALASYSWRLLSANESYEGTPEVMVEVGRDPRVLVIPSHTLGYAGSTYLFQLRTAFGSETTNTANATVEILSGPIVAAISGGTKRSIGIWQTLQLDASTSVDTDGIDIIPFAYTWHCKSASGGACVSQAGDVLDLSAFVEGAVLSIPPESFPSGIEYVFTVTAFKHADGSTPWSKYRSDNASCIISTTVLDVPYVSITPKEIRRKYSPSKRLVLYGCAATSTESHCSNSTVAGFDYEWEQVDSNIGLSNDDSSSGNDQVFRTSDRHPTLVVRAGALSPGRTYTFTMTATGSSGSTGYSEFSFETNAAPVGGYVSSDLLQLYAGEDTVVLHTMGWTDDLEDLPMTYEFGYTHGWHEVRSVHSEQWISRLSSGASSSSTLLTHLPPGTTLYAFNITLVAFVSDILGSTAVTSLGMDGVPLSIVSYPPEQVIVPSLRANLSSLSTGVKSLTDPADALRSAIALSAVLGHAPEPESSDEIGEMLELKEAIVTFIVETYLALDPSSGAAQMGAEALAAAVISHAESGTLSNTTATEVSGALEDMLKVSTVDGQVLESGPAVSLLQTVSVLLHQSDPSSTATQGGGYDSGRNDVLELLGSLGRAVAIGSEAGEDIDEVSTGSVDLKAAKVAESSIHEAVVSIGENGAQVSFEDWMAPAGVQDNSTFVVAVTLLSTSESEEPDSITAINAWDARGNDMHDLSFPVKFSLPTEVVLPRSAPDGVTPTCVYWSESSNEWKVDGVVLGYSAVEVDGTSSTTCWTFHLSPFGIAEEQSTSIQWITANQLTDTNVLRQYWAESWPAIVFLGLVVVLFLAPSALLHWKDIEGGVHNEYLAILRYSYLDRGRCSREDQPVQSRIREKAREAHKNVNNSNQLDSGYLQIHTIAASKRRDHLTTAAVSSIFMNHAWRHLWVSPTEHFKKTLLTRSQHLVIILADWMSAVTLQAIFYGKSQFSIREKAEMTAVTALFMIPTALVFPAMMRLANTPPSSETLTRVRKHKTAHKRQPQGGSKQLMSQHDRLVKTQREEFHAALTDARAKPKNPMRGPAVGNVVAISLPPPSLDHREEKSRGKKKSRLIPRTTADVAGSTGGVGTDKTGVYRDLVASQRVLVSLYVFLPVCMAMFVPTVFRAMGEAERAPGGNQNARLHNVTASLGIICALLCAVSAYGLAAHRVTIMSQAMGFQAVLAPALVLCGAILYGSSVGLATGAVFGGLGTLVCAYFLRVHRRIELVVRRVCEDDLITAWSHPLPSMHSAALRVQRAYRIHRAMMRTARIVEFTTWLNKCKRRRSVMHMLVNSVVYVVILCLTYTNLVFAIKFDRPTSTDWLTTCFLALVVEATLQQPVVLLMTGVLGDFVEEGADFLLEILDV